MIAIVAGRFRGGVEVLHDPHTWLLWCEHEGGKSHNLHHCNRIVIEDGRDVFRGELVGGVRNQ